MKKTIAAVLIFFSLSGVVMADADVFPDVAGTHWAAQAISTLQKEHIVNGYTDGSFRPNDNVTRAEVSQMLYNEEQTLRKEIERSSGSDDAVITTISNTLPSVVLLENDTSLGTGVFIDSTHILTANHVVQGSDTVEVTLLGGSQYTGKVSARNTKSDLALIEVKPTEKVTPVRLTSTYEIGETVIAIGHPQGLPYSVSRGIISYPDRVLPDGDTHFVQFDASISPGNSGGPLLDLDGKLVGIVTEKLSGTAVEGIGFAVQMEEVRNFLESSGNTTL